MNIPEIITTHANTDFDGFAASIAAARLYPEAKICFPGSLNRNVREFYNLHADEIDAVESSMVDLDAVRRLIIVDTAHCNRIGEFERLCGREDVEAIVFDHHRLGAASERPGFVSPENYVLSGDGSLVTTMLKIIHDRQMEISPLEATIFALGIHEDTGSLTFPTTTTRDAEALAICMRLGASQSFIGKYLHNPVSEEQMGLMLQLVDNLEPVTVGDVDVFYASASSPVYVEGLSVVAHKIMDITDCQALIVAVEMEDRTFVVGRSKSRLLDVAKALRPVGGGGHSQASSAIVRGKSLDETRDLIVGSLPAVMEEPLRARDIMSRPVHFVDIEMPIGEALAFCQRYGHSGVSVSEDGMLAGIVARKDLDKAVAHKLRHAPVKGIMSRGVRTVTEDTTVHELRRLMAASDTGRFPVTSRRYGAGEPVPVDGVSGIVTRTDVLRTLHEVSREESFDGLRAVELDLRDRLVYKKELAELMEAVQRLSTGFRGVYLVGGFVRDLILGEANYDVDIAVEGDGIEFARQLAGELGGRVRAHRKFNTAVVILDALKPGLRVDVATTRTEFYDYPAALPTVEHSSIKRDLYRRDFTINAMAVSLSAHDFGRLLDFFGGLADIDNRVIRVLHNLSFIEDPTRIFRAVRYENRLGFRMNAHTRELARGCVEMNLVGDLSSARLRDELIWLFSEPEVGYTITRIAELGLAPSIHPELAFDGRTAAIVERADAAARRFHLLDDIRPWRLRLACLARGMEAGPLDLWTGKLKLRRTDADNILSSVVLSRKVVDHLDARRQTRPEIYELLSRLPAEALILTYALAEREEARAAIELYLDELRQTEVTVSGADLIEMGMRESPAVGRILMRLKRGRLEGAITGDEEERELARELVDEELAAGAGSGRGE
ncbi:MAG: CBS domain-containing protein [Gaiellales bacterium]|nr:MAG: CBS domain-containing protein [Gaiellales bacterium]